jgi:hypothetical protein
MTVISILNEIDEESLSVKKAKLVSLFNQSQPISKKILKPYSEFISSLVSSSKEIIASSSFAASHITR